MKGNYVSSPQWNKKSKPIPLTCFVKQILTQEEVKTLPPDQMQQIIEREMQYDDFLWQKENNIIIDHPKRAEGLNKILYKCCNCGVEHKMYSFGTTLKCSECGSSWTMQENGQLVAREGETRFSHIPDWFDWEDECVKKELDEGKYYLEDIVRVTTLPSSPKFYSHGFGKIIHSADGFRLECEIDGKPVVEEWESISTNGLHIEYDYKQGGDCIAVSTTNDSYWVYPQNKRDVLTKASFATDELYRRAIKKARTKA
jgi:DNA-directed RNA polymerase subunit RPC12/RpoP